MPKISLITPTYNYGRFLSDCIHSVLNQTAWDWELLVCDDGSEDDSEATVLTFWDERIQWLPGEHTGGPAAARNRGIKAARGEYLAFLDADDLLTKDSLAMRLEAMEGRDFVCGQTVTIGETTTLRDAYRMVGMCSSCSYCRMPTVMVRADKCQLFDERLLRYEEKEWFIRMLWRQPHLRKAVVPDVVAYYRQHEGGLMRQRAKLRGTEQYQAWWDKYVSVVSEYAPEFPFEETRKTLRSELMKLDWEFPRGSSVKRTGLRIAWA